MSHCHDPAEKQKYICLSLPMQHVCVCVINKTGQNISVQYDITDTHGHTTTCKGLYGIIIQYHALTCLCIMWCVFC